jgi:glycerol-1-phosphate dehydrogenase [NAD(P)+]
VVDRLKKKRKQCKIILSGHGFGQKRVGTGKDKGEVTMQIGKEMAIPSILKIGNGALGKIGGYLKAENLDQVVLFFGNGLIDMFGELVMNSLKEAEVNVLEYNELDTVDIDDIITLAFAIPNKAKAVISIGGGKVIDAGKYAAFLRNLPFISVPTSSSSDGFSSASASLLVQGKRTSVPARLAYGIIVDTQVIRTAPEKFIYSGIGDMISKITALYDWMFEEKAGCGEVNDFAVMIAKKAVNSFVRTPYESIKDELFLKELLDSLAMSGIANEIAGSSAPTSGSEHLISHALDKILEVPQLHGIQVGIATYIMAKVQDHRYIRVSTVLQDTGFWDYVATLHMKRSDFLKAIDMAPSIKPHRHTYLHEEKYREAAKKLVLEDEVLNRVLED